MKTIGDRLREAREGKGVSIEMAATETHISVQNLKSLEMNDFDSFPAETYVTGFLKSYAEFLHLDVAKTLILYRNYKISEEDAPMEALMRRHKQNLKPLWITIMVLAVAIALVVILLVPRVKAWQVEHNAKIEQEVAYKLSQANKLWVLKEGLLEEVFNVGDRLGFQLGDHTYEFIYKSLDGKEITMENWQMDDSLLFSTFTLTLGEERFFSLNTEGRADFLVEVLDVGLNNGEAVKFKFQQLGYIDSTVTGDMVPLDEGAITTMRDTSFSIVQPSQMRTVVLSVKSPLTVDVMIRFKGYVYFRYLLNGQEQNERYYSEGDQLQHTMKSNMRLWISNAGKVRIKVGSNEVSVGKDGEVVVKDLHWIRNIESGMWDLVLDNVN